MFDSSKQLSEENQKLRLRELQFEHEPLLRRRAFGPADSYTTPVLILALQNELTAASHVIAHHNLNLAQNRRERAEREGGGGGRRGFRRLWRVGWG